MRVPIDRFVIEQLFNAEKGEQDAESGEVRILLFVLFLYPIKL